MDEPKPRYNPDNGPEARAMRVRAFGHVLPKVVEIEVPHPPTEHDPFIDNIDGMPQLKEVPPIPGNVKFLEDYRHGNEPEAA